MKKLFFIENLSLSSASIIIKRLQETNLDNLRRPYGAFVDAHANYLEDIGLRKNLDKVIRPLLNVFDKVGVSLDGDCTYNNILETENLKDKIELFLT